MAYSLIRTVAAVCALAVASFAQQAITVDKLVEFIRSSIKEKLPDKEVAEGVAHLRLSGKLQDRVIEDLQGMGAGRLTVAALTKLADQTANLAVAAPKPPPPVYVEPPPPASAEQEKILAEAREYSLNYSQSLPNFICWQFTRRSIDRHFQSGSSGAWSPADNLVEKLSYFDQQEKYEPVSNNGNSMLGKTWETVGGSISRGEFGSLLRDLFEPQTDTIFGWDHWGTWDKKRSYVFHYTVLKQHSHYSVDYEKKEQVVPGYHGLIYIAQGTNVVVRMTLEPDMPEGFPVQDIHQEVVYDFQNINGQSYLLPLRSSVQSRAGTFGSRNEIDFRHYQKYSADSSIKFDDSDDPTPTPATDTLAPAKPPAANPPAANPSPAIHP